MFELAGKEVAFPYPDRTEGSRSEAAAKGNSDSQDFGPSRVRVKDA